MNIQGWEINEKILPHWDNRERIPYCEDYLFESPTADVACLIYSVAEVRMMDYRGFCAVYKNKQSPKLVLNVSYINFDPYVHFSRDGNLIFLKATYRTGKRFILVLDLIEKSYAVVHFSPAALYEIEELDNGVFDLFFDEITLKACPEAERFNHTKVDCKNLRFRKWDVLENGGELNLQQRGIKYFFKSKEKIWRESIDKLEAYAISAQEFVDLNRNKVLYYYSPFKTDKYGHTKLFSMQNDSIEGKYFPAFSSFASCMDYIKIKNEPHVIFKAKLKDLMKMMDSNPYTHHLGIVIDPHTEFVAIPNTVRVTPKSLRY